LSNSEMSGKSSANNGSGETAKAVTTTAPAATTAPAPKICDVCGGRATGYHFGVMSCEGCKGFFRRNVKKNARFICNYDRNCDVTGERRKNCQACRMARCESAGMRRDRIMMGERRRNRRTDERRAREAAEAKGKKEVKTIDKIKKDPAELSTEQMAQLAQAALARAAQSELIKCEIKSELPETTTPTLAPPAPTQTKQMPQLTPAPHLNQLVDIKTEHTTPPQQQQDKSPFHPVNSSRGEQTTTTPTTSSNPASFGRFSQMETNEGQYAHVMSQYIPESISQVASTVTPLQSVPRLPPPPQQPVPLPPPQIPPQAQQAPTVQQNNNFSFEPHHQSHLRQQQQQQQPQFPLSALPLDGLDRLVEHQVVNYLHERTRNESLGSPSSPNSVSQRSHCSSSIDDLMQAKKKCIDVEMSHIKAARHANFISRHVRDKRKFEAEDEARVRNQSTSSSMPFSILDVDVHPIHDQTTSWVNNARFSSFDSNQNNDQSASLRPYIENHQPLTTPNGSMVGSSDDHKYRQDLTAMCKFSMESYENDSSTFFNKRKRYMEFFADLMQCGVKEIVSYCKLIPEFSSLNVADQELLLRSTILELLILKCYFNYKNGEFLNGENGIWLRREDFILATKDVPFIDSLMQLMQKMADINMTEEDVLLLMLVTLFTQDSPSSSAQNRERIELSKKYFVDKMLDHMNQNRGTEGLLLLPMLRTLKNSFMEVLTSLSRSRTVDLGPISSLIYELKPELRQMDSVFSGSKIPHWPYQKSNGDDKLQNSK